VDATLLSRGRQIEPSFFERSRQSRRAARLLNSQTQSRDAFAKNIDAKVLSAQGTPLFENRLLKSAACDGDECREENRSLEANEHGVFCFIRIRSRNSHADEFLR
jgi:hypothetical protein